MEKREAYSVKDIIFGSRDEYKNVDKYLFILRYLCYVYDSRLRNFYFLLSKSNEQDKPKLMCRFVQETKSLSGLINSIRKKLGTYDSRREFAECVRYSNGQYLVKNDHFRVCIHDKDRFSKVSDELLSLDFVNKMKFGVAYCDKVEDTMNDLIVSPSKIELSMLDSNNHVKLGYFPSMDSVDISIDGTGITTSEAMRRALDFQIPSEFLTQYHRELIDNNPNIAKDIEFVLADYCEQSSFDRFLIDDRDGKKLVLMKVMKDRKKRY